MFEGIHFNTVKFSNHPVADSLLGMCILPELADEAFDESAKGIFLDDCSFLLDGINYICPGHPVSDFALKNLFYIQSFSLFLSGPKFYTGRKNLHSYLLLYTYEGQGLLRYNKKEYMLNPGDAFFIDCRSHHYYQTTASVWKHCDLHFKGAYSDQLYRDYCQGNDYLFHPEGSDFQTLLERLVSAYSAINPYREYYVSSLLNQLLIHILSESATHRQSIKDIPEQLKYLVNYVENNYTHQFSLDYLAQFFGISKYHLCRTFKKYMGFTVMDYITRLRISRAKDLLKTTSLPANKIGIMVGFDDENYFYRVFRKYVGASPKQFRSM